MADEDHSTLYPIYMVDTFSPQDATYVRVGTKVERIAKIYGIDSEGRPAKEKKGGYWVETKSGRVVKSWLVDRYMIEDPHWFSNNSRSLLEAWSEVAPQVMAAAMLCGAVRSRFDARSTPRNAGPRIAPVRAAARLRHR